MNKNIIVSSRVRLARNLSLYPFPNRLSKEDSASILDHIKKVLSSKSYECINISTNSKNDNMVLVENNVISQEMIKSDLQKAVFVDSKKNTSIMVNEEDHIRIQSIVRGHDIEQALKNANELDDKIEKKLEYAFDEDYGYLTACPTNVGTAIRASYMLHLPLLEATNQIKNTIAFLGKLGIAVRGMYGEGTEARGSLYQISNQITLGLSENEIIDRLKDVVEQVVAQELKIRNKIIGEQNLKVSDEIHRAYGTLANAKLLNAKEAMILLSYVKLGIDMELLDKPFTTKIDIFGLMTKIQKANIEKRVGYKMSITERDQERAKIIQEEIK